MATTTKSKTTTAKATTAKAKTATAAKATKKAAKPAVEGKTLIIAEKPSVALDLVKVLGQKSFTKGNGVYESDTTIVSHAIGHLVEIADPKEIDERYKKWEMSTLPMLPEKFPLSANPQTKAQLSILSKLIKRKDVTTIVNACDAGREGELIFFYILDYVLKSKFTGKTIKRLWMQSMTPAAIQEAFDNMRDGADMENLKAAAICRSEADWLIGMNGSRGLTAHGAIVGGNHRVSGALCGDHAGGEQSHVQPGPAGHLCPRLHLQALHRHRRSERGQDRHRHHRHLRRRFHQV